MLYFVRQQIEEGLTACSNSGFTSMFYSSWHEATCSTTGNLLFTIGALKIFSIIEMVGFTTEGKGDNRQKNVYQNHNAHASNSVYSDEEKLHDKDRVAAENVMTALNIIQKERVNAAVSFISFHVMKNACAFQYRLSNDTAPLKRSCANGGLR